jgi:hypothetical protein
VFFAVLVGAGGADKRPDFLGGEYVDVAAACDRWLLDLGGGVDRETPDLLRPSEDAVQHRKSQPARRVGPFHRCQPALDHGRRYRLERPPAGGWQELRTDERAVTGDCGRLALTVVLDVAQPLGRGVGEGGAGLNLPWQRPPPRVIQQFAQPGLGSALREVAGRLADRGRSTPAL